MKTVISLIVSAICLCTSGEVQSAPCIMPDISAECAIVVEMDTGRIIAGKNACRRTSMASTTKIMTSLLLCESGRLDEEITVTAEMVAVEGSSMGLLAGDRVHLRDLLFGMMLASGNDAANVTAITLGGSIEGFADMMNRKAAEIGMTDSHFVTPSGLDDEHHYTTACDMARLAVYAMKNEEFAAAAGSKSATLEYGNPPYRRTLTNHNRLLGSYDGASGIKTGFTKKSGRCLVSCAERDGVGVIAVTLRDPNDWADHAVMLNFGFSALRRGTLEVPDIPSLPVYGTGRQVTLAADEPEVSLLPQDFQSISCDISLPAFLCGPITAGQRVGTVKYYYNSCVIASTDIYATHSVDVRQSGGDNSIITRLLCLIGIK